ncbi:MAG: DEAD/DEAH box helicase [Chromatiales bacterium]|jgi:ATP-dependent RNA helicase SrmB
MQTTFDDLFLDARLLRAIGKLSYKEPTEIQQRLLPEAINGMDIIGSAPTGSGKTVAYLLPVLQGLLETHGKKYWPKALILVPTRELANQVRKVVEALSEFTAIQSTVLIGGVHESLQQQWLELQPEVVVATPGRLLDMLDKQQLDLLNLEFLIIDEADRMLDMGFLPDVSAIIAQTPPTRQTMLFSATMENPQVLDFAESIMDEAVRVEVGLARAIPAEIEQLCYLCDSAQHKFDLVLVLLQKYQSGPEHKASDPETGKTLIFLNTRAGAEDLAARLHASGIASGVLHGDLTQKERNQKVRHFQGGRLSVLIATDVAARGIHIDEVETVINYDMPRNAEIYVHRAGRTGRAKNLGTVISLVEAFEAKTLHRIERFTHQPIERVVFSGLEPNNREPQFKRSKSKPGKKVVKKPKPKQRLRDRKDKGKPKLPLGKQKRLEMKKQSKKR